VLTRVHNGAIASGGQAWLILGTYSNLLSSVAGYFYIFYTLHVYERNMLPNFVKKIFSWGILYYISHSF